MNLPTTLLLGLIAGATIVFGLPIGRMQTLPAGIRVLLNAIAVGILIFLTWDVLSAAWEPVEGALTSSPRHLGTATGYGALMFVGVAVGLLGLVRYERWMGSQTTAREIPHGAAAAPRGLATWSQARRLSLLIAVGIGLHNFAEGLAIGQSAASGTIALAVLLVIGFGLHNATEGFGIVAPLAGDLDAEGGTRVPSWGFLLTLGLIGGGPTFLGTVIGHGFTSEPLAVLFLSLAAGSIVYVIVQLVSVAAKQRRTELLSYGILIGLLAGFLTDAIVTAAGA